MNKYELSEAYIGGPTGEIHPNGKMRLGKGGSSQTSTTVPQIPTELKPLAELYTKQASNIAQTPFQAYQGQRYTDLNPTQNAGIGMIQNRALYGSETMNNAEGNLNQLMQSGPNPYLDSMYKQAARQVTDAYGRGTAAQTDAAFARSKNYGGSAYNEMVGANQQALGSSLGGVAENIYGRAYESDQNRRLQAISQAPTFGQSAYQDAGQLLNAGQLQQNVDQNNLDFGYDTYSKASDYPFKQLQATGGVISGNMGSSTASSGGGGK